MSLEAGHPFAHYEILEPIGKRGTREVYRVRDGKLGRDVALKLLPDEFAQDPERLRRFQREAKLLASLKLREYLRRLFNTAMQRRNANRDNLGSPTQRHP